MGSAMLMVWVPGTFNSLEEHACDSVKNPCQTSVIERSVSIQHIYQWLAVDYKNVLALFAFPVNDLTVVSVVGGQILRSFLIGRWILGWKSSFPSGAASSMQAISICHTKCIGKKCKNMFHAA